jgi:hypothetical protein
MKRFGPKRSFGEKLLQISRRKSYHSPLGFSELRWNYVILVGFLHLIRVSNLPPFNYLQLKDEGHCIRNPNSQIFKTIGSLVSKHRLILSGTPVQNSPADLWALFSFLMPGYLSNKANFHSKYMKHIMACRNPKATEQQTKVSLFITKMCKPCGTFGCICVFAELLHAIITRCGFIGN